MLFYCIVMLLVGFHLAHGVWSAFQSLGMNGPRFTKFAMTAGYVFAAVIGLGFFLIPLIIFYKGGAV
jgi:succinate dehydrogenase / fumarate reductase cytochrome b subunit